jgi:hypothetical protein
MSPHKCIDNDSTKRFKQAAKIDKIKMKECEHYLSRCKCVKDCRHKGKWKEISPGAPEACSEDSRHQLLRTDRVDSTGIQISLADDLVQQVEAITIHDQADWTGQYPGTHIHYVNGADSLQDAES